MATTTHRHVFYADSDAPEAAAEWSCACGHVVVHADGDPDGSFVLVSRPRQPEFAALDDADDPLLERLLEGLAATPDSRRRTA